MKPFSKSMAALRTGVGLALLGSGLVGCSTTTGRSVLGNSPREDVVDRVNAATAQTAEVNSRIDSALRALDDLANHPEARLNRQFDRYTDALSKLESETEELREEIEAMGHEGREYLVSWDREIATISDNELRERTAERRQDVAGRIDTLHGSYVTARERLAPLVQRLREIESAIRVDLTSAGIKTVRPAVDGAVDVAAPARDSLRELAEALRQTNTSLAAVTQAPIG
jgi:chromosome segregation ATPase